jgi:hypothetical protein
MEGRSGERFLTSRLHRRTNMKTVMLAMSFALWFASDAAALESMTLAGVCDRLSVARETIECFQAVRGQSIDALAAGACDSLSSSRDTIACVAAAAGREYEGEEVRACDRLPGASDTIECLAVTGRPAYRRGPSSELRRVVLECRNRNRYAVEILRCIELRAGVASSPR